MLVIRIWRALLDKNMFLDLVVVTWGRTDITRCWSGHVFRC